MSKINLRLYKNIVWIYLSVLGCFAYNQMLSAIPDHVYVKEGEVLHLDAMVPVSLSIVDDKEVMADVGESTYHTLRMRREGLDSASLKTGSHEAVCYLFGFVPVKEVEVSVVEEKELFAAGHVVGIYGATQGVLVLAKGPVETVDGSVSTPSENLVFPGDYITAVNDEPVREKEDLIELVDRFGEKPMVLSLWRGEELIRVSIQAVRGAPEVYGGRYLLGLWVKDDMAGIGTLTYYDSTGSFGALGHGIGDGETGGLLRIERGELYASQVLGIVKGRRGVPGELQGVVYYGDKNELGVVSDNTQIGIYGQLNEESLAAFEEVDTCCSVGYKQDVKTGDAVILSDASGELSSYHIQIDSLDYSPADRNKGIRFHVDDQALLDLTGGIVQGLSGSPILQNGRLIGAVTHVLVNEPTQGYAVFVEEMLGE